MQLCEEVMFKVRSLRWCYAASFEFWVKVKTLRWVEGVVSILVSDQHFLLYHTPFSRYYPHSKYTCTCTCAKTCVFCVCVCVSVICKQYACCCGCALLPGIVCVCVSVACCLRQCIRAHILNEKPHPQATLISSSPSLCLGLCFILGRKTVREGEKGEQMEECGVQEWKVWWGGGNSTVSVSYRGWGTWDFPPLSSSFPLKLCWLLPYIFVLLSHPKSIMSPTLLSRVCVCVCVCVGEGGYSVTRKPGLQVSSSNNNFQSKTGVFENLLVCVVQWSWAGK